MEAIPAAEAHVLRRQLDQYRKLSRAIERAWHIEHPDEGAGCCCELCCFVGEMLAMMRDPDAYRPIDLDGWLEERDELR